MSTIPEWETDILPGLPHTAPGVIKQWSNFAPVEKVAVGELLQA